MRVKYARAAPETRETRGNIRRLINELVVQLPRTGSLAVHTYSPADPRMPPSGHVARRYQQQRNGASRRSGAAGGAAVAVAIARRKPELRHLEAAHSNTPRHHARWYASPEHESVVVVVAQDVLAYRHPSTGHHRFSRVSRARLDGRQADIFQTDSDRPRARSHARRSYVSRGRIRLRQNGIFRRTCTRTTVTSFSVHYASSPSGSSDTRCHKPPLATLSRYRQKETWSKGSYSRTVYHHCREAPAQPVVTLHFQPKD